MNSENILDTRSIYKSQLCHYTLTINIVDVNLNIFPYSNIKKENK